MGRWKKFPVNHLNCDQLQRRPLVPKFSYTLFNLDHANHNHPLPLNHIHPADHMDLRLVRKLEFDGCLVLSMLCGVPTPPNCLPHQKVCAVSPPPRIFFPQPQLYHHQESMCGVPPMPVNVFATLGLHLGFSARLRIWQVSACKMEP